MNDSNGTPVMGVDYTSVIEAIEAQAVELNLHLIDAMAVCGTSKSYDQKRRISIPSIWTVNKAFNAKIDLLNGQYESLTELVGNKKSLIATEAEVKAHTLNPLLK